MMRRSRQQVSISPKPKLQTVGGTWHCNLTGHQFLRNSQQTCKPLSDQAGILTQSVHHRHPAEDNKNQRSRLVERQALKGLRTAVPLTKTTIIKPWWRADLICRGFTRPNGEKEGEREWEKAVCCALTFLDSTTFFPGAEGFLGGCWESVLLCEQQCYFIIYHRFRTTLLKEKICEHKNKPTCTFNSTFIFKRASWIMWSDFYWVSVTSVWNYRPNREEEQKNKTAQSCKFESPPL